MAITAGRAPLMRALLGHVRNHRGALLVAMVLTLLAEAAALAQPLAAKAVVDALGSGQSLLTPVLIVGALVAASAAAGGFGTWVLDRTAERVVFAVRKRLAWRLLRLRVAELDTHPPGDLISRATADSTLLHSAASTGLVQLFTGTLSLIGGLVLMAVLSTLLLGVTLVVLIVVAVAVLVILPKIRGTARRAQQAVGRIGAALDRALSAARTVKASGAEARETARIDRVCELTHREGLAQARYSAAITVIAELSTQVSFLIVLGVGGALVATGSISVSTLIAFLLYVFYLTAPIAALIGAATMLQNGLAAVGRIGEVDRMTTEPDVDREVATAVTGVPPTIELDGVSFAYPGREPVLHDVRFTAPAGRQTAIVGLSGAGKTTLFALITRFHEPAGGRILLDGADIAALSRAEVRRRIGLVASLPDGLDTQVGTRGTALSGGERQRLAIARALLRRPQVLLLDEATSQLDARNESGLREAVAAVARTCTVLLIAHRLSTVTAADRIVLLDGGRVRATGTHDELIAGDPLYAELAATQLLTPTPDPA